MLRRRFSDGVTAATLGRAALGHRASITTPPIDSSYSHAYSFFLLAAFLSLTDRWYRDLAHERGESRVESMLLGVVAGLIVLTRHTNAVLPGVFRCTA